MNFIDKDGTTKVCIPVHPSIFQKQFGESIEITVVIQYILTATQPFALRITVRNLE